MDFCEERREKWCGRVGYLGDDEISVIQRGVMEVNEDVVVTQGWNVGFVVELEAVKAVFGLDSPLLGSRWCHYESMYGWMDGWMDGFEGCQMQM